MYWLWSMAFENNFRLEFEIPDLPKRPNQLLKKTAIWLKSAERKKWLSLVGAFTAGRRPPIPLERATISLTRHSSVCPDYDGLVLSFKFVIDALVTLGIIEDDAMVVIGVPLFDWVKAKKNDGKIRVVVAAAGLEPTPSP